MRRIWYYPHHRRALWWYGALPFLLLTVFLAIERQRAWATIMGAGAALCVLRGLAHTRIDVGSGTLRWRPLGVPGLAEVLPLRDYDEVKLVEYHREGKRGIRHMGRVALTGARETHVLFDGHRHEAIAHRNAVALEVGLPRQGGGTPQ